MIDFEEELKKFQPSLEVEEAEEAIYSHNLTDMTDIRLSIIRNLPAEGAVVPRSPCRESPCARVRGRSAARGR